MIKKHRKVSVIIAVMRARKSMMCGFEREYGAVRIVRSQEELW
jgi:hypothetical protein